MHFEKVVVKVLCDPVCLCPRRVKLFFPPSSERTMDERSDVSGAEVWLGWPTFRGGRGDS
eukprot:scaffold4210_cov122-Isochrysis_galbana.AAC.4